MNKVDIADYSLPLVLSCNNCEHMKPKENEQSEDKEPHICQKRHEQVFHHGYHPELEPICMGIDYEVLKSFKK